MADVPIQPNDGSKIFCMNTAILWFNSLDPLYQKSVLDRVAATGATAVRIIGYPNLVFGGTLTQTQYEDMWRQVADYAVNTLGLWLYPAESSYDDRSTTAAVWNLTATHANQWADVVSGVIVNVFDAYKTRIMGYDICQEVPFSPYDGPTAVSIYNRVKSSVATAGKTMPYGLTMSFSKPPSFDISSYVAACDFLDFHFYQNVVGSVTASDINTLLNAYPTKQFFMGEAGYDEAHILGTSAWITSTFGAAFSAAVPNQARMRGGAYWVMEQYWNTLEPASDFGLYACVGQYPLSGLTPRAARLKQAIQLTSPILGPTAPSGLSVNNGVTGTDRGIYWNPRKSTAYDHSRLYRNGQLLADNIPDGRYDDSAYWSTHQARYQASVVTTSAVESAKSASLILPGRLPASVLRRRVRPTSH